MVSKAQLTLANWLNLPASTIIDYMHASFLGTTKHILNKWLSLKNKKNQFYFGSQLCEIYKATVIILNISRLLIIETFCFTLLFRFYRIFFHESIMLISSSI